MPTLILNTLSSPYHTSPFLSFVFYFPTLSSPFLSFSWSPPPAPMSDRTQGKQWWAPFHFQCLMMFSLNLMNEYRMICFRRHNIMNFARLPLSEKFKKKIKFFLKKERKYFDMLMTTFF